MSREKVVELIPALRAFARVLCSRADEADDLVQETLTKAIANLDQFQPGTRLKSWLFTIMRNTFNTNYQKAKREKVRSQMEMQDNLVSPPSQDWSMRATEVKEALARLPVTQREILFTVVLAGESYEDAAQICQCAIGTVKSRLFRARRRLIKELGEDREI